MWTNYEFLNPFRKNCANIRLLLNSLAFVSTLKNLSGRLSTLILVNLANLSRKKSKERFCLTHSVRPTDFCSPIFKLAKTYFSDQYQPFRP